ncbi:Terminase small subunit [Geosporobacter subterraneus DSM 17957]|uniref:Terminase small subunit n=1 Tax=Geosporobacter subterraneus DSM 17957 TaxID=1121919 RepID=A0A1M6DQR7_9FIRM|nr:terminase small subunit [Geosporobacter subterraneus]SHI75567.1 Terminase small subunit [Geosporobacter subterraneus DSM 17957]
MRKLTPKQEKFVQELIKGKSQREAYKLAYNASNMSDKVIDVRACELLKNSKVAVRYDELRSKLVQKAEEQAIMSAIEVLKEIESIAKDNISNYIDFRTEKTLVGYDEDGTAIFGYRPIVDMKDSRTINTKNISEVSIGANGQFKFKMYCRDTALYKLAELLGADVIKKAKQKLAEERFAHEKEIDGKRYW